MNHHHPHDNIDPAEIAKFGELAARWWDAESEFKPLHQINPLRLDFIDKHSPLAGKSALDVGCGGGLLCEAMAARGARVTGIDAGEAAISVAQLHALESGAEVEYRQMTAEELAAESNAGWDVVCCLELLEHVPRPESVVAACAQLAKPGGAVYFSTINRNLKSFMFAIVGAEYALKLLPRGTHQYEKLIRPSELARWCERAGLALRGMIGMHYNPLRKTYSLGPGVSVNYFLRCEKIGAPKTETE
ncbi:MAG: bifunctional 2-polyprenyl-6-hydroxyphenol methylase/3-demethylubiquinol 3-O-methyltransferase UbiG [Gammaproteobacteria bacterium]|nr:bifunctional 2-polyprenyl-6-hydroxyphenol methylase/3-demethylubiquinol 3-O-methyltransferase UbiG [Gammaproteobacteria bacterium]